MPRSSATNTTTSGRFFVSAVVVVHCGRSSVAPSAMAARTANIWVQRGDGVLLEALLVLVFVTVVVVDMTVNQSCIGAW